MTESELCERYLPLLRAFARRRVRDRVEADELAQETLFVVIRALREGRVCSREKLGAYVLGVGRNLVREGYRRDRRARELVVGLAPLAAGEAEAPRVEHHQRLRQCMSRLTPTARAVLQRAIIDEESGPEIAEALGLSPVNVRVIRHRALAEVRRCFQSDEP